MYVLVKSNLPNKGQMQISHIMYGFLRYNLNVLWYMIFGLTHTICLIIYIMHFLNFDRK